MIDIKELLQNLSRAFAPIAALRRNRLTCSDAISFQIGTSLEEVLPTFTSFVIRSLYFFDDAHLHLDASTEVENEHVELRLALQIPKIYFNPNLLLSAHEQKILYLDNAQVHATVVFVKVMLEDKKDNTIIEQFRPPTNEKLDDAFYSINFKRRFESVATDAFTLQQLRAVPQTQEQAFLEQVNQVIYQYLDKDELTGEFLQMQLGLSKAQLFRKIKKLTQYSTANYIRYVRIGKAQELLQNTQMGVGDIAYKVGFAELSYFTHCFKEQTGCSPTEWRQQKMKQ